MIHLNEQGFEQYPLSGVILGNIVMLVWIALGTVACWFFLPPVAWIFLAYSIIMVYFVMRRLVCVHCYYYDKWCSLGWGKLSAMFFKQRNIEQFPTCFGLKIAPIIYASIMLIPTVFIIVSLFTEFSVEKVVVLGLLLITSVYSSFISRRRSCGHCRMQTVCPGAVVKPVSTNPA